MQEIVQRSIEYCCDDLFNRGQNHILLYGEKERTLAVLRGVYEKAKERDDFRCSFHDASAISDPMDFFEPVLSLKYGPEYQSLKEEPWFKELLHNLEHDGFGALADLCKREDKSIISAARKLPVIFIDGIEELFFNMDYDHLDEKGRHQLLTGGFMDQPLSRGFGNALRSCLHQTGQGIIYGTVRNTDGIKCAATLENYHYLFYKENFMHLFIRER